MNKRGRGIVLSYIYTALNTVLGIFMSAFIIRILGQIEYGVYQTMTSFLSYIVLFEFGTGTIMTRNISLCAKDGTEKEKINKNVSTIMVIALFLCIIILSALVIFYLFIPSVYSKSLTASQIKYGRILFAIVGIRAICAFLTQTMNGAILGFEKYSFQQIVKLIYLLVRTGLVITLILLTPYSLTIVIIDTSLSFVELFVVMYYCFIKLGLKIKLSLFDFSIFRMMLPLAFAMFLQTVVNMANGNVDKFVIGVVMSPEAVSVYSVGLYIYTVFSSLTTIPISMYMPQIAKNMKEGMSGFVLTKSLVQPCRLIAIIGGLILFGFVTVGKQFIVLVYGEQYVEAWLISIVIMGPMYINMCNGVLVNVLDVLRKRMSRSIFLLFTTIANIGLTIWWIVSWGMLGAAVATGICTLIGQDILMNIYYKKKININVVWLYLETFKGILIPLIISSSLGFCVTYLFNNVLSQFFVGGIVFVVCFSFFYLLIGANNYEKDFLRKLTSKLIKKDRINMKTYK